jgi:hypothetical protein
MRKLTRADNAKSVPGVKNFEQAGFYVEHQPPYRLKPRRLMR